MKPGLFDAIYRETCIRAMFTPYVRGFHLYVLPIEGGAEDILIIYSVSFPRVCPLCFVAQIMPVGPFKLAAMSAQVRNCISGYVANEVQNCSMNLEQSSRPPCPRPVVCGDSPDSMEWGGFAICLFNGRCISLPSKK